MNIDPTSSPARKRATGTVSGVLALELTPGTPVARPALPQAMAAELAALVGRDLERVVPGASALDFSFAAAHFDPAEALRPGWPLHRRLEELHARAPRGHDGPRLIAFGADAAGEVPLPLRADPGLAGGVLRILPFQLHGEAVLAAELGERFETLLLDQGMVQPDTALLAQQAFGARIEHARYLTVHDLAAMTALQYEHMGLAPLWPIIETALLAPTREVELDAPPEPLLRYADGEARIALFPADAWRRRHQAGTDAALDEDRLQRHYAAFETRQKQFAAVLEAHGIPVVFEAVGAGGGDSW